MSYVVMIRVLNKRNKAIYKRALISLKDVGPN
jgi:hypothetical protein